MGRIAIAFFAAARMPHVHSASTAMAGFRSLCAGHFRLVYEGTLHTVVEVMTTWKPSLPNETLDWCQTLSRLFWVRECAASGMLEG